MLKYVEDLLFVCTVHCNKNATTLSLKITRINNIVY